MGLAASQTRFLALTARKSNLEYQVQQINQQRMEICDKTNAISTRYSNAIAYKSIMMKNSSGEEMPFSVNTLFSMGMVVVNDENQIVNDLYLNYGADLNPDKQMQDYEVEAMLRDGSFHIATKSSVLDDKDGVTIIDWRSDVTGVFSTQQNDEIVALAEAEYETETTKLNNLDKKYESQLKLLDTQHNAVQTEMDAVKKVIDKNIETSFKTFG